MANGFQGLETIDNLMKDFEAQGRILENQIKQDAIRAGAKVLREKIKNHPNIPVSGDAPHARDNIELNWDKSLNQYDIGVLEDFFYLLFHEIGAQSVTYKAKDGKKYTTPNIPAKPFMRPALENNVDEIQDAMGKVIRRALGI